MPALRRPAKSVRRSGNQVRVNARRSKRRSRGASASGHRKRLPNLHHWVTESGDTIFLNPADLTAFTTSDPNRVLADYVKGIEVMGGTGAFAGATGTVFGFGAADLNLGQITLRYAGTVCFRKLKEP
jgi:hypothetical protein